jgi:hypothetical protein
MQVGASYVSFCDFLNLSYYMHCLQSLGEESLLVLVLLLDAKCWSWLHDDLPKYTEWDINIIEVQVCKNFWFFTVCHNLDSFCLPDILFSKWRKLTVAETSYISWHLNGIEYNMSEWMNECEWVGQHTNPCNHFLIFCAFPDSLIC